MKTFFYPTAAQIDVAVKWCNKGPRALDPPRALNTRYNQERTNNMSHLRELMIRIALPDRFEDMRMQVFGRSLAGLDDRILSACLRSLRMYGYVYRLGPVQDGRVRPSHARTPLSGRDLHIVRLLAQGLSLPDAGDRLGLSAKAMHKRLYDLRETTGCVTNAGIVAMAYDLEWIPALAERERLGRLAGGPVTWPGYLVLDTGHVRPMRSGRAA